MYSKFTGHAIIFLQKSVQMTHGTQRKGGREGNGDGGSQNLKCAYNTPQKSSRLMDGRSDSLTEPPSILPMYSSSSRRRYLTQIPLARLARPAHSPIAVCRRRIDTDRLWVDFQLRWEHSVVRSEQNDLDFERIPQNSTYETVRVSTKFPPPIPITNRTCPAVATLPSAALIVTHTRASSADAFYVLPTN